MASAGDATELFAGLRVAAISDGLDAVGRHDVGLVAAAIRPLWVGARAVGRALTARYVATNEVVPPMAAEEYQDYSGRWYRERCPYPFLDLLKPGDLLVVDLGGLEVGFWESNLGLAAAAKGAVGAVIDGGGRDAAELARQQCAVWCRTPARTSPVGRLEFESLNQIINCGGARVAPGDIVAGDDDGVIVVPKEFAAEVARYAREETEAGARARRALCESQGRGCDESRQGEVKPCRSTQAGE